MIHPHTELRFINPEIGSGVFATGPIPKGTVVWVRDRLDREFTPQEVAAMEPPLLDAVSKYCYRSNIGNYVLCWDHTRYVNHSFTSNCVMTAYHIELAVRDIAAGEELTDDYGYLNIIEPFEAFDEGHHRKVVYPDDLAQYHAEWDKKLLSAFRKFQEVDQPLRAMIADDVWETCRRVAAGEETMQSILACYYNPGKG